MAGYQKLISEKNFLKVRLRARQLMRDGTDLVAILYKDRQLIFKTASGTYGKRVMWTQTVEITDAFLENLIEAKTFRDVEHLIKNSDLKVNCTCPAFLYWGFKYIAWKKGYGLERELRRPKVRNPHEEGFVCFVAGTQVLTEDGYKNIEDIKVGDKVFTHKGRLREVEATSSHKVDETISVRYGNTWIRSTKEHPYLAEHYTGKSNPSMKKFKDDKVGWVPAKELHVGDFLVAPRFVLTHEQDVPRKEAFFAGLYAGDGSMKCRLSSGNPSVHNGKYYCHGMSISYDVKHIENYQRIFDSYGIVHHVKVQTCDAVETAVSYINDKCLWQRCLDSVNFTNESWGEEKHSNILHWSEQAQREYVKGFFLADGTIVNGGGSKGNNTVYCTLFNSNKQMMDQLFIVMRQWYDVKLDFYDREPFEEKGRMVYPKRIYYIRLTGAQCVDFIENIVGPEVISCKSFGAKGYRTTDYKLGVFTVDSTIVTPKIVKEIIPTDGDTVYNIQVAEDESFIVEDVAVHNCKHLYLVMSLYPFWAKALAKKFKDWATAKEGAMSSQNIKFDAPRQNRFNRRFVQQHPEPQVINEDEIELEIES